MNGLLRHLFTGLLLLCFVQLVAWPTFTTSSADTPLDREHALAESNDNSSATIALIDPDGNEREGNAISTTTSDAGNVMDFVLTLADVTADQGDNVCLPITVQTFTSILGMQFSVNYDASNLSYTGPQNFNAGMVAFTAASIGNPTPGNLTFTWNDPFAAGVTLPDGAIMVELCFDITGNNTSTVNFSGSPTPIEIINAAEMEIPFNSESGTVTVNGGGGPSGFTLTLADVSANQNDNVCLPITVNDFNSILGMQFSVNYDAAALTYTGPQNFNPALVAFTAASIGNPTPGNLTFTWNDPFAAGVTLPNGATMVELCFDVTTDMSTTVAFSGMPTSIEIIDGNEMEVPFNSESGTITLGGGPPALVLTLADVTANQGDNVCLPLTVTNFTDVQSMQYNINYDASILAFTGAQNFNATLPGWGASSITNPSTGVLTVNWTNGSGVSLGNNSSLVTLCFDVTGNTTSNITIPNPITIQDGNGAAVNTTSNSGTVTVNAPIEGFTLILTNTNADQGDNVCLPITVNDFENILGMQFSVNYDAAALTYTGPQNFNPALVAFTAASIGNPTPGNLTFTWNDPFAAGVTLPNGATMVELCFDVTTDMSTTVVFSGTPTSIEIIDGNEMEVEFNSVPGTISPNTGGPQTVTLTLADVTANPGDNVCLPLTVNNFTDVQNMQFNINYDASILSFTGAQNFSATLPGWGMAQLTNPSPGVLTINWSNPTGVTLVNGSTLVTICFDITGMTTSNVTFPAPVTLQNSDGVTLTTNTNTGTVSINPPIEGFTLILADATASNGDNVCLPITVNDFDNILGMQFSINYDPAALTYTGPQNFNPALVAFTAASIGNPTAGNLTFTWNDPFAAGVTLPNGDVLVELCFDVTTDMSTTVAFSGTPTSIEIIDGNEMEVEFNSVSGTISPPGSGPLPITLTLADVAADQGDNVCLNLTVTNFTDVQSTQYNINYNSSILSFTGAQNFNAALPGWGAASITNPSPGVLTVNWSNASGISLANGSTLVSLCFDVTGNTTSDVTIPAPITIQNGDGVTVTTNTNSGTVTINAPIEGFTLILADATASNGDNVCLPITVNDFNNILGMQFSINYDAAALTYTGPQNFNPALVAFTAASIGNPTAGNLTFTWNDPFAAGVTLPNGDVLVELCFDVTTDMSTTVVFSGTPTSIEIIDGNEMEVEFNSVPGTISPPTSGPLPITLALQDVAADQGDNVCLNLTVTNFTDIQSTQYNINYNSSILSFTGAQNFNAALPGWGAASITNPSPGVLTVNWSNASGISLANGSTLVSLCFDVTGNTTSDVTIPAPITIQNGDGVTVTTNTNSGTVTINAPIEGFTLILADATASSGDNVCLPITVNDFENILGMQFSINYDAAALTYTGPQNFNPALVAFTAASIGNPTAGNLTFTWNDPFAAGVTLPNGDVLVELCFDVLTDVSTTVVFSGMPTSIEIIDGNEMEVEFNSVPGTISPPASGPLPITLNLQDVAADQGDNVCLDLTVTNFTDIQSTQYNINYNSSILAFTGAQNFNATLPGWGAASITNPSPGVLTVNWSNASGISLANGSTLVSLCFDVAGNTTSDVTIPTPITILNGDGVTVTTNTNSGTVSINPPVSGFALILADATVETGDNVCLPMTVNDFDNILGMQFSVNYDPAELIFTGAQNFNAGLVAWTAASIGNPNPGELTTTWNDPFAAGVTLPDGAVLVELCFDVLTTDMAMVVFSGTPTPIEIIDGDEMEVPFTGVKGTITIGAGEDPGTFAATLSTEAACNGESFCMDLTASTFTNIQGMQFSITYNSAEMSFAQVNNINPGLPGLTTANFNPTTGVVIFDWDTNSSISLDPNTVLFSICFNKLTDNPTSVSIGGTPTAIEIIDSSGDMVAFSGTTGQVTCDPVLPLMFGQVDVVNLICADDPIGSITIVNMVNGSGPYNYEWSIPGASGASVTGLEAATVSVTVTDTSNGMTVSGTYDVTSPPAITSSVDDITNILCAGESTGSITISAGGGVDPLMYDWSGTLPDNQTTQNGLPEGSYSVTITDANGCQETINNILINELADPIVLTGNVTAIPGDGNPGNINLSVAGGMPGFTYSWTGPGSYTFTGEDPNNITVAGEYCVTVTDAFNCTASTCFDICESLQLVTFGISDACPGGSNGDIGITISGGCCPEMNTYSWINLATNLEVAIAQDLEDQPAGNYRVMITDCTGESISADFTIGENDAIVIEGTVVDVMGSNDGSIAITVNGGSGSGYSYQWSGPGSFSSTMQNISGLTNGLYCVTVTDDADCTEIACFEVNPAPPVVINMMETNVSCPGDEDGCIFLAIAGGLPPMSVTLNDGSMDLPSVDLLPNGEVEICDLPAGDYTFTVTDNGIGSVSGSFIIGTPDPLSDIATITNDTEDATGGSGSITVNVNGGTGTPVVNWNGFPSGFTIVGITGPTTVTGTIVDENGCTLPVTYEILQLTEEANIINAGCADSDNGSITAIGGGATEPYSYIWTITGSPAPISTDPTLANLPPGFYTVRITDATGASLTRNYEITADSDYSVSADVVVELDCFDSTDGEIEAFVDNNGVSTVFNYEFVLDGAVVGTNTIGSLENAAPGMYTINVVDNFMCAQTTTVTLTAPQALNVPAEVDRISCDEETDGRIELNPTGGTSPYIYEWSTGQTTRIIGGLEPGSYTVTVTDDNDCQFINSYEIEEAMPIIVTIETTPHEDADNCDGTAMAIVLGGQPPYSYEWLNVPDKPNEGTIDSLCAGTYMLQVTDANGCTSAVVSGVVVDDRFECFSERVVITPDGNGSNDEFIIFCAEALTDNHLEIYNRWGQLVFETDGYVNDWEGTSQNGDELPAGPYYWVLDYSSPGSGEPLQKRGSLTIVRD